jgi:plastocyanin
MDHSSNAHGGHDEHGGVHLPDPSIWPLVVGAASLLLGAALIYWTRDRGSDFAGPLLGMGILATMIAAFGWAYEDGKMKKKAEEGLVTKERDARFTQVVTFAVVEGMLDQARTSGIIAALEKKDSALMNLDGFQDLRIIASPAETGPSQVLVETTWADRSGLATYEQTRQTLLDLVANYPEEVVSGSVQVFDMEVIRDTKDVAFRFGKGAAATVIGSLLVGGFMVGAGLNMFAHEGAAAGGDGGNGGPAPDPFLVIGTDNRFNPTTLRAAPNIEVTFTFENRGRAFHNLVFLDREGGSELAPGSKGAILGGGQSETITFTTPGPGTYFFYCELHPVEMRGVFEVVEGGPGGAAPPAGEGGAG